MQQIETNIDLDFQQNNSGKALCIQQGDAAGGRVIRVTLYDNGRLVELTGSDTAKLYASTNGIITATDVSLVVDSTHNRISIPITSELSSIAGEEKCVIRVTSSSGIVHAARFSLLVGPSPVNEDMPFTDTTTIAQRFDQVDQRIDGVEANVTTINNTVTGLGLAVNRLRSEMDMVDDRFDGIEDDITDAQTSISTLNSRLTRAESDIDALEDDVSGLQSTTSTLGTRVGDAEDDIDQLQTDVSGVTSRVAALEAAEQGSDSNIYWSIISSFPEVNVRRLSFSVSSTSSLRESDPYVDINTSQYDNFDYTWDGVILMKNQRIIEKPRYYYTPINNYVVIIGEQAYISTIKDGVRISFINTTFANADTLYAQFLIKPYKIIKKTQAEYDALTSYDERAIYIITG